MDKRKFYRILEINKKILEEGNKGEPSGFHSDKQRFINWKNNIQSSLGLRQLLHHLYDT